MKIISNAQDTVLRIMSKFHKSGKADRLLHYCAEVSTEEGVLLLNLLTRELVLLTEEEYRNLTDNEYLNNHWFTVSEKTNDKELADLVEWVLGNQRPKLKTITHYTIFTTTDCNARCFYCYELGRSRIPMSAETAHKVVRYIKDHCGGEEVKLNWYGGEPLFNQKVIDIICAELEQAGVKFTSKMISNGYLLDRTTIQKAQECWNLKWVQITLDGTEEVYNKVKAFIYRQESPYKVVMENIKHLLDAEITVHVRMNMDLHNAENLLQLVEELAHRFEGRKGLHVYAFHLFEEGKPMAGIHTEEEWDLRDAAMCRLNEKIRQYGLLSLKGIRATPKLNHCMADSGSAVTILPGGEIGLCDHFSEREFIGHIDREGFDQAVVSSWKERIPKIPECAECFYYPSCQQLKKCVYTSVCFEQLRRNHRRKTEQAMLWEYRKWKNNTASEMEEETAIC